MLPSAHHYRAQPWGNALPSLAPPNKHFPNVIMPCTPGVLCLGTGQLVILTPFYLTQKLERLLSGVCRAPPFCSLGSVSPAVS